MWLGAVHKLHDRDGGVSENNITGLWLEFVIDIMNYSIIILFSINNIPSSSGHFFIAC